MVSAMANIFRKAWADTFHFLGGTGFFVALVAIPVVGFSLHAWLQGSQAMMPEFQIWLIYGLASAGLVFFIIFLWNIGCAPYRIERQRRECAEVEILRLKDVLGDGAGSFSMSETQQDMLTSTLASVDFNGARLNVLYNPSFSMSLDLADKLGDAIRGAGIECTVHTGALFDHDPKDRGIIVYYGSANQQSVRGKAVSAALARLGFSPKDRVISGNPNNNPHIYVARPPRV